MKSFVLTVISFFLIILLLNAGYYKDWFQSKPQQYWEDFKVEQDDTTGLEGIRKARYGVIYTISMKIKETIEKKRVTNAVILFEPNSYYRDSLHLTLRAPEPALFYYYTGLTGVWTSSAGVNKANYFLRISKKGASLDEIKSPQQLHEILARYQKFTPIL